LRLEIVEEKQNPVLKRKAIMINLDYEGRSTTSKAELQLAISKQLNVEPKHVEIKKIMSNFGKSVGKAWVNVWEEKEVKLYGAKKKEGAPSEKPAEAPKEEKKEEPKKEE